MREVWIELRRHYGGAKGNGDYVHPARRHVVVNWLGYQHVRDLAPHLSDRDRLQEQAAALLFMEVTGFFVWDRRNHFGPRTRTKAEVQREMRVLQDLAAQIRKDKVSLLPPDSCHILRQNPIRS
jgi:hypothetical protein